MADHSYSSNRVQQRWKDHCYFSFAKKTPKVVLEKALLPRNTLDHSYVKTDPICSPESTEFPSDSESHRLAAESCMMGRLPVGDGHRAAAATAAAASLLLWTGLAAAAVRRDHSYVDGRRDRLDGGPLDARQLCMRAVVSAYSTWLHDHTYMHE